MTDRSSRKQIDTFLLSFTSIYISSSQTNICIRILRTVETVAALKVGETLNQKTPCPSNYLPSLNQLIHFTKKSVTVINKFAVAHKNNT